MMYRFQWDVTAACAMVVIAGLLVLRLALSQRQAEPGEARCLPRPTPRDS